jgi:hypothetical protein
VTYAELPAGLRVGSTVYWVTVGMPGGGYETYEAVVLSVTPAGDSVIACHAAGRRVVCAAQAGGLYETHTDAVVAEMRLNGKL